MKSPIGVFDSGVGGLSIVREIKKILPHESIIYLADKKNFPYGEKTRHQIQKISKKNTDWLIKNKAKLIVIACNTATVNAISHLRKIFSDIDIVGVEPAVKTAGKISRKGMIILSTPKASSSRQLKSLIRNHSKNIEVFNIPTGKLSKVVESESNKKKINKVLQDSLSSEALKKADVLVLGCTHFPLITKQIQEFVGRGISVIDPSEAVAKRVEYILKKNKLLNTKGTPNYQYFTSGKDEELMGVNFVTIVK